MLQEISNSTFTFNIGESEFKARSLSIKDLGSVEFFIRQEYLKNQIEDIKLLKDLYSNDEIKTIVDEIRNKAKEIKIGSEEFDKSLESLPVISFIISLCINKCDKSISKDDIESILYINKMEDIKFIITRLLGMPEDIVEKK